MCAIDDAEPAEILQEEIRKARKEHRCSECRRAIAIGEEYLYEFTKFDGETHTYKTCAHCQVGRLWLQRECGGWVYGMVHEDLREHVGEYQQDKGWKIALLKLTAGMQRKWRGIKAGTLRPIPVLPEISTGHG